MGVMPRKALRPLSLWRPSTRCWWQRNAGSRPGRIAVTKGSARTDVFSEPATASLPWKALSVIGSPEVREVRRMLDISDLMVLPGRCDGTQKGPTTVRFRHLGGRFDRT